jgi:hypothetical protein
MTAKVDNRLPGAMLFNMTGGLTFAQNDTMTTYVEKVNDFVEFISANSGLFSSTDEATRHLYFTTAIGNMNEALNYLLGYKPALESINDFVSKVQEIRDFVRCNLGSPGEILRDLNALEMKASSRRIRTLKEDTEGHLIGMDDGDGEDEPETDTIDNVGIYTWLLKPSQDRMQNTYTVVTALLREAVYALHRETLVVDSDVKDKYEEEFYQHFSEFFDELANNGTLSIDAMQNLPVTSPVRRVFDIVINQANKVIKAVEDDSLTSEEREEAYREAADESRIATKTELVGIMKEIKRDTVSEIKAERDKSKAINDEIKEIHEKVNEKVSDEKPDENPTDEVNNEAEPEEDQGTVEETPDIQLLVNMDIDRDMVLLTLASNNVGLSEAVDDVVNSRYAKHPGTQRAVYANYLQSKVCQYSNYDRLTEAISEDESRKKAEKMASDCEKRGQKFKSPESRADYINKMATNMLKVSRGQLGRKTSTPVTEALSMDEAEKKAEKIVKDQEKKGQNFKSEKTKERLKTSFAKNMVKVSEKAEDKAKTESGFMEDVKSDEEYQERAEKIAKARENEGRTFDSPDARTKFIDKMSKALRNADEEKETNVRKETTLLVSSDMLQTQPPSKKLQQYIMKNSDMYSVRYGSRALKVLMGRAWRYYNQTETDNAPQPTTESKVSEIDGDPSIDYNVIKSVKDLYDIKTYQHRLNAPDSLFVRIGAVINRARLDSNRNSLERWSGIIESTKAGVSPIMVETITCYSALRAIEAFGLISITDTFLVDALTN